MRSSDEFNTSVPARFKAVARTHGARTAVDDPPGQLTYADLNSSANRLAKRLLEVGRAGDRVAVLLTDASSTIVTLLAILKAGRIAVVLNPEDPSNRLAELVADSEPTAVVAADSLAGLAKEVAAGRRVLGLDAAHGSSSSENLIHEIDPDGTAQLVYTSGSTGEPKGVMQTHGRLVAHAVVLSRVASITPDDRVALLASLWGGQGVNTLWTALLSGATVVAFPAAQRGVTGLGAWLERTHVTIFVSASSLFRHFVKTLDPDVTIPSVRLVKVSADAATWEDFAAVLRHFPEAEMMSAMGSAEIGNLAYTLLPRSTRPGQGALPVGRSFPGMTIEIVDENGDLCPPGVAGAIVARGRHMASGYWRDAALTARHLVRDEDGTRTFRSADLGRFDADGMLVLAGRQDSAYKIRGQRVDLAEAERQTCRLPGVDAAAVIAEPRSDGELQLIAFVVARKESPPTVRKLRAVSRGVMARHLIPSQLVMVDDLPRTGNGKIDLARLRQSVPQRRERPAVPETDTERLLVRLWEEAFDIDGISRDDDFLELGGDSLIAAVIAAGVQGAIGVSLDFGVFVDHPVLAEAARAIDTIAWFASPDEAVPLVPVARNAPIPLSLLQEPCWEPSGRRRNTARATRAGVAWISGPLDRELFTASLTSVIERHEILRTRYGVSDGVPVQIIGSAASVPVRFADLSRSGDSEAAIDALIQSEREHVFDLSELPPVRFTLITLRPDYHALVRANHHIIADAPSWNTFFRDVCAIYEAKAESRAPDLPDLPVQYADFAAWQRRARRADGPLFRDTFAWWKKQYQQPGMPTTKWLSRYLRSKTSCDPDASEWQVPWGLDPETTAQLDQIGRDAAATYYMVRLAAVVPVLALASGEDKVVVGGVFANRGRAELQHVFGLFANAVAMVFPCDWDLSFRDHLLNIRRSVIKVQKRSEIPWFHLGEALRADGIAVPPLCFWMHMPTPLPPLSLAGLQLNWDNAFQMPMNSGIVVRFDEHREQHRCLLSYNARLYDGDGMQDLIGRLAALLRAAARDPDASLAELTARSGAAFGLTEPDSRAAAH